MLIFHRERTVDINIVIAISFIIGAILDIEVQNQKQKLPGACGDDTWLGEHGELF